jgi:nucleotide-binding universal stress UspA family protein
MKKAKRILVGLKTLDHAVELTDLACRLGARGASVLLIHILELPDPTPLDAKVPDLEALANKILRAAERVAVRSEIKARTLPLRAHDAGPALLDEMKNNKVDLAVIGYHHKLTLGEILLGTTGKHLARHAPCHPLIDIPANA